MVAPFQHGEFDGNIRFSLWVLVVKLQAETFEIPEG